MYRGLRVAVVVPAFNEEAAVGETVAQIPEWVDSVVVIDDASLDRTAAVATSAATADANGERVDVARHPVNRGVGAAIITGYRRALALGIDPAPRGLMDRRPRRPDERVIDRRMQGGVVVIGATMALVTDYDCWHEEEEDVSVDSLLATLGANSRLAAAVLRESVLALPVERRGCRCGEALKYAMITDRDAIPQQARERLAAILG